MALFERADTGKKVSWISIIGIILIPLVIAGGFVAATWKVSDRMDSVKAVIVNDDDGAMMNGAAVPLGRQLVGGMMDDNTAGNYKWVLSDKDQAEEGLRSGEYVAAIYIPKDFSENVLSGATADNPSDAVQATISITTSKASPLSDGAISIMVGNAAREKFNREYAQTYLNNIYLGFNQMGKGYQKLADGSDKLADGTEKFSKGIGGQGKGVTALGTAGGKLGDASTQLGAGGAQLAANAPMLKKGGDALGDAGTKMAKGAPALKKGGDGLAKGGKGVAKGVKGVDTAINSYQKGIKGSGEKLQKAAAAAKDGKEPLDVAVSEGVLPKSQASALKKQLCTSEKTGSAATVKGLKDGLKQGDDAAIDAVAKQAGLTPEQVTAVKGAVGESSKTVADKFDTPLCIQAQANFIGGMSGGMTGAASGLTTKNKIPGQDKKMSILDISGQVSDGAGKFAKGLTKYTDGVGTFATGVAKYGKGVSQYTDGVGKFADGVGKFGTGVAKYTGGVAQYTGGVQKLSEGMPALTKGADGLAEGNRKFADGLQDAADDAPHYSKDDRKALKKNVVSPIKVSNMDILNKLPIAPTVALLLIMSLWLGALITYTVVRGVSASALTSRKRSVVVMLKGLIPGLAVSVIQALGLSILCQFLFKNDVVDFMSVLGFTVFAGITYTVVNFALVALFGGVGRFISVVLLALGIAANIITAVPGWLSALAAFSPVTYGINGVTAIVTGADGLGKAFALLLVWLVAGVGVSIAAVARRRRAGFDQIVKMAHA